MINRTVHQIQFRAYEKCEFYKAVKKALVAINKHKAASVYVDVPHGAFAYVKKNVKQENGIVSIAKHVIYKLDHSEHHIVFKRIR